ncbi:MAG TPA: alpha/beta hydrolase-fold protein [Actinomycetota bacterium]|nr:alpha/beta hydrolase-fold protein [Actinomycetota bacterium]
MRRRHLSLHAPGIGADGDVVAYGHYGRPVLAFPSEQGRAFDYEDRGMVAAVEELIDGGRVKLYCVDSYDAGSWHAPGLSLEDKARRHELFDEWITGVVVPWIHDDCGGPLDVATTGCSFGAYHAANFALRHADLFPLALCHSGVYDVSVLGGGERGDAFYFNNPTDYVANLDGDHLEWLRARVSLVLVCGQGQWEDTTGALESTRRFAALLGAKGIPVEMDLWGHDVPHDWPSWRAQIAHHLPRFC